MLCRKIIGAFEINQSSLFLTCSKPYWSSESACAATLFTTENVDKQLMAICEQEYSLITLQLINYVAITAYMKNNFSLFLTNF